MRRRHWGWITLGLSAAGLGVVWRLRHEGTSPGQPAGGAGAAAAPGPAAATEAFWAQTLQQPDGGPLALASFRGAPLLVNFWATWCPPCVREMPLLDRFHAEFGARGWRVLGLAIDRNEAVSEFLRRQPVGYPIAVAGLEGMAWVRALGNEQGGLPFSVAFDARGQVTKRKLGEISEAELRDWARG